MAFFADNLIVKSAFRQTGTWTAFRNTACESWLSSLRQFCVLHIHDLRLIYGLAVCTFQRHAKILRHKPLPYTFLYVVQRYINWYRLLHGGTSANNMGEQNRPWVLRTLRNNQVRNGKNWFETVLNPLKDPVRTAQ